MEVFAIASAVTNGFRYHLHHLVVMSVLVPLPQSLQIATKYVLQYIHFSATTCMLVFPLCPSTRVGWTQEDIGCRVDKELGLSELGPNYILVHHVLPS